MSINIVNNTERVVLLRLNSGRRIHLGGKESSQPLPEPEIRDNRRLSRMQEQGVITVQAGEKAKAAAGKSKGSRPETKASGGR